MGFLKEPLLHQRCTVDTVHNGSLPVDTGFSVHLKLVVELFSHQRCSRRGGYPEHVFKEGGVIQSTCSRRAGYLEHVFKENGVTQSTCSWMAGDPEHVFKEGGVSRARVRDLSDVDSSASATGVGGRCHF